MKRIFMKKACFSVFCMLLTFGMALSAQAEDGTIEIDVAPNVLNIQSEGKVVTVHTDIPFSQVGYENVKLEVTLNGIPIKSYKSDARGYFVAKFSMLDVEEKFYSGYFELGPNILVLKGLESTGEEFLGSQ
ncbi:MAG: hypothetical protein JRF65_11890, partial [Deltaproteobacteria bacterium]|nr:hypothetical protein [Deltaproteobacteria bacterium]